MAESHGYHGTPTYISWMSMKARCNNPNHPVYRYYGGRGIKVCPEWNRFVGFLDDMGERPEGYQLGRLDVNGDYEPSNCEWNTEMVQQSRLRSNKFLEYGDKRLTCSQWAREIGVSPMVVINRALMGWPVEKTLSKPQGERRGWLEETLLMFELLEEYQAGNGYATQELSRMTHGRPCVILDAHGKIASEATLGLIRRAQREATSDLHLVDGRVMPVYRVEDAPIVQSMNTHDHDARTISSRLRP